jgi:tripartite-type tricarboxylate transporter receptor subunit TctC
MNRRQLIQQGLLAGTAAAAGPTFFSSSAIAQGSAQGPYPNRPIRLVVPWPAGGIVDIAARQVQGKLRTALGQPIVVENRAGAGGNIGADQVAKAAPDGYTLMLSTSALTINTALRAKMPFNLSKDIEGVGIVANAPSVLVAGPSLNVSSVKELTDMILSRPGRLTYASAGVGSPAHLVGELYKVRKKLFVIHVPYTGAPAAMLDQVGGRIDYQFANMAVALPQIRAGKVKPLAITSGKRHPALPQVPTMAEAGIPDFEVDQWLAVLAPRGIPKAVSDLLVQEINKALGQDDFREALAQAGMSAASPSNASAFESFLRQDETRWGAVIKSQGIQPE